MLFRSVALNFASKFNRHASPDNERGVAIELGSEVERDAFLREIETAFAARRFTNSADAFDTVKAYVLEHPAKQ